MDLIIIGIAGVLLGGLVNSLADTISEPAKQNPKSTASRWRTLATPLILAALMIFLYIKLRHLPGLVPGQMLIWQMQIAIFFLLALVDLAQKRIQLVPLVVACSLALFDAAVFSQPPPALASAIVGSLVGFGIFLLVYLGGRLFRRMASQISGTRLELTVFGLGDVYLMAMSGLILGFPNTLIAILLTIFLGGFAAALHLITARLTTGRYQRFTVLPYGPFILGATYLVMMFQPEITALFLP